MLRDVPFNTDNMIIILSSKFDQSTNNVVNWLNYMGEAVVRINTDDNRFIFDSMTSNSVFFIDTLSDVKVNLLDAKSCWWRRRGMGYSCFNNKKSNVNNKDGIDISFFTSSPATSLHLEFKRLREFIYNKLYEGCEINLGKPVFDFNRLIVSDMAKGCGLTIPNSEIITTSEQLYGCKNKWNYIVSKAISNGIYEDAGGYRYYTYTELLDDIVPMTQEQRYFPSLVTQMVDKSYEIRSFYLDGYFFSMAIFSQSSEQTKVDFRKYDNNRTEPYKLPAIIEEKTRTLFHKLNINSGSVDYIVDERGNYVFLEINPVGQFGMTDYPCNYNLDYIIADYLINGKVREDYT